MEATPTTVAVATAADATAATAATDGAKVGTAATVSTAADRCTLLLLLLLLQHEAEGVYFGGRIRLEQRLRIEPIFPEEVGQIVPLRHRELMDADLFLELRRCSDGALRDPLIRQYIRWPPTDENFRLGRTHRLPASAQFTPEDDSTTGSAGHGSDSQQSMLQSFHYAGVEKIETAS